LISLSMDTWADEMSEGPAPKPTNTDIGREGRGIYGR
jgi:hypothetical protein